MDDCMGKIVYGHKCTVGTGYRRRLEKEAVSDIVADTTDTVIVSVCWHV